MSDHVDGPRQIGDPAADLTDLFAFNSPENAARTVLGCNVFPAAGANALFSNAVSHSIVVRRATVAGQGDAASFKTSDPEYRFTWRFTALEHGPDGSIPVQGATCTLPGGQELKFVVNDQKGASTPDGVFRVFAGLRSDPFILAWMPATLKKLPNLIEHDNVLAMVVEFDTHHVLDPSKGSLFGVIAETTPVPAPATLIGKPPPRFDWVGRPEQTNMRLNNPAMEGAEDLRDLWNQLTPFAIAEDLKPLFRQRLIDSLTNWDMRDDNADFTPAAIRACANVYLDDFMLIDVSKPTTDMSYLEIEKSTLQGRPYQTGGGRTVNSNVVDIMISWMVNNDREHLQGGSASATKPGGTTFPYLASPNTQLQAVAESMEVSAPPDKVWALVGAFGGSWHPLIARIEIIGSGIGQLRKIETIDGKEIVERLEAMDSSTRTYRYTNISGLPASNYMGTFAVRPKGANSIIEWRAQYLGDGQGTLVVKIIVSTLFKTGLEALKKRFG
jgi:Polyketide cyclase / dehydrase and lipid transport/Domain of unknown function (DUF4331)